MSKFNRSQSYRKNLKNKWRKPKGLHNKKRLNRKGRGPNVKPGYGTKDEDRHTYKGLKIVHVSKIEALDELNPKEHAVIIASMGKRKKQTFVEKAKDKGFKFANFNAEKYLEKVKEEQKERKEERKQIEKRKEEKQKEVEKKKKESKDEEEDKEEKQDPEEKKKQEKKEQEKIITKSKWIKWRFKKD